MKRRSRIFYALFAVAVSLALLPGHLTATAEPTDNGAPPPFCATTGPIDAALLATPVELTDCEITGRLVRAAGLGTQVPEQGVTSSVTGTGKHESATLTVTNKNGHVSARLVTHEHTQSGNPTNEGSLFQQDQACQQSGYVLTGGSWGGILRWYYNASTAARAGLPADTTLAAIRRGNQNITLNNNDCGYTGRFTARGEYQGTTQGYANINSQGNCTDRFTDGFNGVSWGPFDDGINWLAVACIAWGPFGGMYEADIYLGSNRNVTVGVPAGCTVANDLEALVTHEWGHAFGLGHPSEAANGDLTMSPALSDCSTRERTLGRGDYLGMRELYGVIS